MNRTTLKISVISLVLAACATQSAPAPSAPVSNAQSTAAPEAVVGPPSVAWADMSKEQKGKFMKAVVMPKMKPIFAAYDPQEFGDLKCSTCHGKDPKAAEFKMPTPDLPVLPGSHEGFVELAQKKPKMMAFMKEQVLPQMAELLGVKMFNPATPQEGGFGCMGCHTMQKGS